MQELQVQVDPQTRIVARRYEPCDGAVRASVVIGGAMGVRQNFYAPFAGWLAAQGLRVFTYDYRGSGASKATPSLRGYRADLIDWARDYEAAIDAARAAAPALPLYLLGHSLGAQLPGFLQRPGQVDGLLGIATGSGYWRDNAPRLKRMVPYFWWVLVPIATRLYGYFPGRKLRKVGDLPAGVVLQWRRWCLDPDYSVGAEGPSAAQSYGRVRFPVLALSITDDEMMTRRGTRKLVGLYTQAPQEVRQIAPAEVQAARIGHFGFFHERMAATLWPRALDALRGLQQVQQRSVASMTA